MSLNHPKSGPNNVGSYQVSGIPFVTGSTGAAETITRKEFPFPFATRFITLSNSSNGAGEELRVAFSAEGAIGGPGIVEKYEFLCPLNK